MKRIILSLSLILAIVLSAGAQPYRRPHPIRPVRRHYIPAPKQHSRSQYITPYDYSVGDVRLHILGELGLHDIGGIFMHNLPYHYSVGGMAEFQAGQCLSLGLGAEFYGTRHINRTHFTDGLYLNCVPIYGNVRLSTTGRVKLFAEARAGYAIPTNQVINQGQGLVAQGFYTGAAVGFGFYGNNFSFGFNSIDIRNVNTLQAVYYQGCDHKVIATDFYLRYSYAIPLN